MAPKYKPKRFFILKNTEQGGVKNPDTFENGPFFGATITYDYYYTKKCREMSLFRKPIRF